MQGYERTHGVQHLRVYLVPLYLGIGEVVQGIGVADFLSLIDQGHTVERELKYGECISVVAVEVTQRVTTVVVVLVVVGQIDHTLVLDGLRGIEELLADGLQRIGLCAFCAKLICQTSLEAPGIVVVETTGIDASAIGVADVCLAQEFDGLALALQFGDDVLPIANRDGGARHVVATIAIDVARINPELQRAVHLVHQTLVLVVQLEDVVPSVWIDHLSLGVLREVLGMCLDPGILHGNVVGHPVEPHFHAVLVGCCHKCLEVVDGSIGGIDLTEVHRGVGTHLGGTTWIGGHQPEDVSTQCLESSQLLLGSLEGSLGSEGSDVHLVDDAVLGRNGLGIIYRKLDFPARVAGCQKQHCNEHQG